MPRNVPTPSTRAPRTVPVVVSTKRSAISTPDRRTPAEATRPVRSPLMASVGEYEPGTPFPGVIGRTVDESVPAWPVRRRARPGVPNVVFVVLDDVGFAQLGCYGSPIATPVMDRLASEGLLFNNMHATAL